MKTKLYRKDPGIYKDVNYFIIVINFQAFNMTKLKQSKLCFMIYNSTASSNDVNDGQADEPANIDKATDSDQALEKEGKSQTSGRALM